MKKRIYKFDNIKVILIFLVVLGHFLELITGYELLYLLIYSFHMPLFIFLTGYFARFNKRKILTNIVCPYIIFQILYTYFEVYFLENTGLKLTFTKPVWLLWYLFAILCYYLLIPVIETQNKKSRIIIMLMAFAISLISGCDAAMGYLFSASRILVFFPFFIMGFYCGQEKNIIKNIFGMEKSNKYGFCLLAAVIYIVSVVYILKQGIISKYMLYGSYSYEKAHYSIYIRFLIMLIAIGFIIFFLLSMPNKRIPVLTNIGSYTMPVFLLHGFVVKLVDRHFDLLGEKPSFDQILAMSIVVVVLLGNKYINKIFNVCFCLGFIQKKSDRK